ncbi:MAG: VWA domain-containing protein [Lachnospiraceae bacterium]|nr:VWA domain-containing protein [Lachnospiraceae bacterium]MBQ6442261.1 VWA domain-containing protein [Lachnospiraceae bacterium]
MKKKVVCTLLLTGFILLTACGQTQVSFVTEPASAGDYAKSYEESASADWDVCVEAAEACPEAGNASASYFAASEPAEEYIAAQDFQREGYRNIEESGFVSVRTQPFSTFAADVDTACYANLRRTVTNGYGLDPSALRIEELINYFDYDYKTPQNGDKFGVVTTYTACPWNENSKLLRVGIKAEEVPVSGGSNLVFLIDTSGSMFDDDKLPLVQKAFRILSKQLTAEDTVSIVTYAGSDTVLLEGARGDDTRQIMTAIDGLEAYGCTNGEGGIRRAYEIAEKYYIEGGNNRVILATDGDLNVGISSEAGLTDLIEEEKETGVMLSCLGFGTGNYMDDKMEALADHGNGNYSYIDCEAEAEKVLRDELFSTLYTVAKDVKFQVEFNPAAVQSYRLIGYENRKMAAEDFADDTKDGGEVGSGQTVTVLYEVLPVGSAEEVPVVVSRYGNDSSANTDEIRTAENEDELLVVNIRYKEPDAEKSVLKTYPVTTDMYREEMDPDTSFAAGVAQLGMLVRDSEQKGSTTYAAVYDRLKKLPQITDDDQKLEFLTLIKKCEKQFS